LILNVNELGWFAPPWQRDTAIIALEIFSLQTGHPSIAGDLLRDIPLGYTLPARGSDPERTASRQQELVSFEVSRRYSGRDTNNNNMVVMGPR